MSEQSDQLDRIVASYKTIFEKYFLNYDATKNLKLVRYDAFIGTQSIYFEHNLEVIKSGNFIFFYLVDKNDIDNLKLDKPYIPGPWWNFLEEQSKILLDKIDKEIEEYPKKAYERALRIYNNEEK